MDATELLRALARLTPEEKQAAQSILGGAAPPSDTPRFSKALDQVAESDVDKVVEACVRGLTYAASNPGDAYGALQPLQQVAPVVASAAQANSAHRNKPISHSLKVAADYLLSPQAEQRREERKRAERKARIHQAAATTPAPASAPAAPSSGEPGKGK